MDKKTKELLEKQLQLLSERSPKACDKDLAELTHAMCEITDVLLNHLQFQ